MDFYCNRIRRCRKPVKRVGNFFQLVKCKTMKKIRFALYSSAFILAISASFAFKPGNVKFSNAFVKTTAGLCNPATCDGGAHNCIVSGLQGYTNSTCTSTAKMP